MSESISQSPIGERHLQIPAYLSFRDVHLLRHLCRVHLHVPKPLNVEVWTNVKGMYASPLRDRLDMLQGNHLPQGDGSVRDPERIRKPLGCAIAADYRKKTGVAI